jgi:hypothetical protein
VALTVVELGEGAPFRWVVLLSMLPHDQDSIGADTLRKAIASAFRSGLDAQRALLCKTAVTPVLKSGWRISSPDEALSIMLRVLDAAQAWTRPGVADQPNSVGSGERSSMGCARTLPQASLFGPQSP